MTYNDALLSLYHRLDHVSTPVTINWDEAQQWPLGALKAFIELGFIKATANAQSLECNGCEYCCFSDVLISNNRQESRAFIVCDVPEMQAEMGRINIPLERLQQWQTSNSFIANIVTKLLGLENKIKADNKALTIKLGMSKGEHGRRWVALNTRPLSIEINQTVLPIDEVLYFEDKELELDRIRINLLLNSPPVSHPKKYTHSTAKRENRKLQTQLMYQNWNDEYLRLSKTHPTKSKTWYSQQIAKMPIAQGRDANTIVKNMINCVFR